MREEEQLPGNAYYPYEHAILDTLEDHLAENQTLRDNKTYYLHMGPRNRSFDGTKLTMIFIIANRCYTVTVADVTGD